MRIHHRGSNHGDDDLVAADDAAPGGFGEGDLVRDGAADFRRVHRIDEPGVAVPVAVAHVVMAGRGCEEEGRLRMGALTRSAWRSSLPA